jgi:hypothetical protein
MPAWPPVPLLLLLLQPTTAIETIVKTKKSLFMAVASCPAM